MFPRWFATFSFRLQVASVTLVALLALLGLLVWQTWGLLEAELRSQLQTEIERTNTLLSAAVALPMAQRDYATLSDIAKQSVTRETVNYVVIMDHLHRHVASAGWPADKDLPAPGDDPNARQLHVLKAIHFAKQPLGEVQYGVSLRFVDEARATLAVKMLRIGAVGVLFGLLLLLPLGFWVTRRLALLEAAAQRLAAGKLDEHIDLPGGDELSRLASTFNHMADSLAAMITNLRNSEARFHHAVQGSNDGIWDWDLLRREYYYSPRHKLMLGYRDDEIPNVQGVMEQLVPAGDQMQLAEAIRRHFEEHEPFDCTFRMRHKDGHLIWCRSRGQAQWDDRGQVVRFSGATSDITEQKQAAVALEHLAHFDPLTQLPNRTLLADRMAMALALAQRSGERLAVALLDLDDFKLINDTFGHDIGDLVLIEVAARLRASLREVDTIARLGGDEFVLVLSCFGDEPGYDQSLQRVLATLAEPCQLKDVSVTLSGSIGVTFFPDDDADADTLIRHADHAMYVAKQTGRNRYHVFDAMTDRDMQARLIARQRIATALDAGEFRLYYQPKVDLRKGRMIGAEALIRWQHPERGLVAPGDFLPLIEDSDFAILLSEWVIETALGQLAQWRGAGLDVGVSVNLPARHLQHAGFPEFLAAALARHPTAPAVAFELEVLESAALEDVIGVSERMEKCRKLGVRFALDDFGTGYASLAYLRRLPIDLLKIDQSFVRDMLQDPDDMAIVEGVIGLATSFRDAVIAEGVETIDHAVMLLHLGCDLAQGYGIARPMPPAELPTWAAAWRPDPALEQASRHGLARADLPLIWATVEHRRWVEQLTKCVEPDGLQMAETPPLETTACRFGYWLHGDGLRHYGTLAKFHAINALHEQVHDIGRRLIALRSRDEPTQVRGLLADLHGKRDELLDQLHGLILTVAQRTGNGA